MQIRPKHRFADTTARDAHRYDPKTDVNQWVEAGSIYPFNLYRISAVSTGGVGTFEQFGSGSGASPTGPAGGDLGGTYPNPTVLALESATTRVAVGAATAPTAGQVLTATSASAANWQTPAAAGVSSVFGRTGAVVAAANDYAATQLAAIAAHSILGNDTSSSAAPIVLTNAQVVAELQGISGTTLCVGNDARLSDDRTASGLRTASTVVAVSSATAPTAGQALVATASNAATWQTLAAGSTAGASPLYTPPVSAGAIDLEFDSTSMPGAIAFYDLTNSAARTPSGAVDPYTALTGSSAVPRTTLHTNGRRSFLQVQVTDSNSQTAVYQAVTPPTNVFYWCRISKTFGSNVAPTSNMLMLFQIWGNTSSHPDTANTVYVGFAISASQWVAATDSLVASVSGGSTTNGSFSLQSMPEYFAIHKVGTKYYPYIYTDAGSRVCMKPGGFTNAATMAYLGCRISTGNATAPYDIFNIDFFREQDVAIPPF